MLKWLPKVYNTGFDKLDQILDQQAQILKNQETLVQEFKVQIAQLIDLVQKNGTKKKPGPLLVIIAGEDQMADKILFRVVLPAPSAADVVTRELTVDINGTVQVLTLAVEDSNPLEFSGDQGAQVSVSLVDIDDFGNRSAATSTMPQQLADNFAPPAPGDLGFELVGEILDDTIEISEEAAEPEISAVDTADDLDADTIDDSEAKFSIG